MLCHVMVYVISWYVLHGVHGMLGYSGYVCVCDGRSCYVSYAWMHVMHACLSVYA